MTRSVLIVDDDLSFRTGLRAVLESAGFSVREVGTAEEAMDLLQEGGIHVALIDLDLPRTNGFDLIRVVSRQYPALVIIAVTGIYMQLYLDIARNVGAHAAVRKYAEGKPLPPQDWVRLVVSATGESATA